MAQATTFSSSDALDHLGTASGDGDVMVNPPAALDALGRILFPLFYVSVREHA